MPQLTSWPQLKGQVEAVQQGTDATFYLAHTFDMVPLGQQFKPIFLVRETNVTIIGDNTLLDAGYANSFFASNVADNQNLTLKNLIFARGNSSDASVIPRICGAGALSLKVVNCTFTNNTTPVISGHDGPKFITDSLFVSSIGPAAVLMPNYATLNVTNSTFMDSAGFAIEWMPMSTGRITGCRFIASGTEGSCANGLSYMNVPDICCPGENTKCITLPELFKHGTCPPPCCLGPVQLPPSNPIISCN
jgi:hypothetical protein